MELGNRLYVYTGNRMTILEIIAEWRRGCSCNSREGYCIPCTDGAFSAIEALINGKDSAAPSPTIVVYNFGKEIWLGPESAMNLHVLMKPGEEYHFTAVAQDAAAPDSDALYDQACRVPDDFRPAPEYGGPTAEECAGRFKSDNAGAQVIWRDAAGNRSRFSDVHWYCTRHGLLDGPECAQCLAADSTAVVCYCGASADRAAVCPRSDCEKYTL